MIGLGVKSVTLSPNGMYAVAAMFETKIRLFNAISMKEVAGLDHQQ